VFGFKQFLMARGRRNGRRTDGANGPQPNNQYDFRSFSAVNSRQKERSSAVAVPHASIIRAGRHGGTRLSG
jgi:hypothetical protein